MPTPSDDRRDLLVVVAHMHAAPGKEDELKAVLEGIVPPTRDEDGCVGYDLYQAAEDPGLFYFYESWETPGALDAHLQTPHLTGALGRLGELVDDKGLTITRLRRIA